MRNSSDGCEPRFAGHTTSRYRIWALSVVNYNGGISSPPEESRGESPSATKEGASRQRDAPAGLAKPLRGKGSRNLGKRSDGHASVGYLCRRFLYGRANSIPGRCCLRSPNRSACYLLPATCYLLPATCYLLPATCYPLPATHYRDAHQQLVILRPTGIRRLPDSVSRAISLVSMPASQCVV